MSNPQDPNTNPAPSAMPMLTPIGSSTSPPEKPAGPPQLTPVGTQTPTTPPAYAPPTLQNPTPTAPPTSPPATSIESQLGLQRPTTPPVSDDYEEAEGPNKGLIFGIIAGVVVLAVAAFAFFALKPPAPALIPTEYEEFTAKDGTFKADTLAGWKVWATGEAAGETTSSKQNGLFMQSGGAKIDITMSRAADMMGAELMFGKEIVPESMTGSRAKSVEKMQKTQGGGIAKKYKGYSAKAIPNCPSQMGGIYLENGDLKNDALLYEFTADSDSMGLGGKKHGYRAYVAGKDLIATVHCESSEVDFPKLKKHFLHIIGNVQEIRQRVPGEEDDEGSAMPGMPPGVSIPR